jgi:hypothetical protein
MKQIKNPKINVKKDLRLFRTIESIEKVLDAPEGVVNLRCHHPTYNLSWFNINLLEKARKVFGKVVGTKLSTYRIKKTREGYEIRKLYFEEKFPLASPSSPSRFKHGATTGKFKWSDPRYLSNSLIEKMEN